MVSLSSTVIKNLEELKCDRLRSAAIALKETVCSNVSCLVSEEEDEDTLGLLA